MPKSTPQKLTYQRQRNARPEEVKKRTATNAARREAMKGGRVHKGDGKEIDHKVPLDNGGSNSKSNMRVDDGSTNAGWRKGQSGYNPGKQRK